MSFYKTGLLGLAMLAALTASSSSFAVTASAQLYNLNFRLYDLDLSDNVEPTFEILSGFVSHSYAYVGQNGIYTQGDFGLTSASTTSPTATATANGDVSQTSFSARAETLNGSHGIAYASTDAASYFKLGAGTGVELTFESIFEVTGSNVTDSGSAYGQVTVRNYVTGSALGDARFYSSQANNGGDGLYQFDTSIDIKNSEMTSISVDASLYLAAESFSNAINVTSAVPESETYAMLLAGLGVTGAAIRRRKAKQA